MVTGTVMVAAVVTETVVVAAVVTETMTITGSSGDNGGEGDSVVIAETVMVTLMVTVVKDTVW